MAIYNSATSGTALNKGYTASQVDADLMGIAYETPGAGTFSIDVYSSANDRGIDVYSNGTKIDSSSKTLSSQESATISYTATGVETIYIVPTGGTLYFEGASFVPTTADAVTKTVTLKGTGGGYATFSATQNYDLPEGVTAYIVSNVSETAATLTSVSDIPACTGVILYKEGVSSDTEITLTSKETTTANVSSNMLKANIVDYELPASGTINSTTYYNYTLAYSDCPTFKHVASETPGTLAAGKAFLRTTVNVTGDESKLSVVFEGDNDNETTGINTLDSRPSTLDKAQPMYNLVGQRVGKDYKGVVIVNGKKYINK